MTTIDQALLNAIRGVVGEAVAPLGEKIDGLTVRVDGLTERVDGLTVRVDGLFEHVSGMTEQMEGMREQVSRIELEQREQRSLLANMDLRLTMLEATTRRLETQIETIEMRSGQLSSHVYDLLDRQDKMNAELRTLRREVEQAFQDIDAHRTDQRQQVKQLRERIDSLERRVVKLENPESPQ